MPKELERDLGLWSVMAISVGAMVGSGIFILPALAMKMAGPAVVLAYAIAAILVAPAALSKSEMATAMPEAGGTYLYIERGMGPLLGTIAGIGTWFSLTFKSALALVGGAPYLLLLFSVRPDLLAIGTALVLIVINLVGVKQTGRMQVAIVGVMLAAMVWFVTGSGAAVDAARFTGFFEEGPGGIVAAAGFVYVSYAGVTKIASVAEEVEDPDRVLPLGMLGSLAFTALLYILVVVVIVGAAPDAGISGSNTPVADIASTTLPEVGVLAVVLAAILALISTANAGLLSSSRYPFAMSRDNLAPSLLRYVSARFDTPAAAILLTGGLMLLLIWQVPLADIAKLASAFKILVFVLVNLALVAFRESDIEEYDPAFEDPFYPWTQTVGVVGGLVLLTQMGTLPMVGAVLIVAAGLVWYFAYVRSRADREGVARGELRRRLGERAIAGTAEAYERENEDESVVVAVTESMDPDTERSVVQFGAAIADARDGQLTVAQFDEVPDQLPLESAREKLSPSDVEFEARMNDRRNAFDVPMAYGEVVSHDVDRAIVNFAGHQDADLLVLGSDTVDVDSRLVGHDLDWVARNTPCDLLMVDTVDLDEIESVALVTDQDPFDPLKMRVADAIAALADATVELIQTPPQDSRTGRFETIEGYHDDLTELLSAPVTSRTLEDDDPQVVAPTVDDAGLVIVGGDDEDVVHEIDDEQEDELWSGNERGVVVARSHDRTQSNLLGRLMDRLAS